MIQWEIAKLSYMKCGGSRCSSRPIAKGAPYLAIYVRTRRPLVRCIQCAKEFEDRGPATPEPSPDPDLTPMSGLMSAVASQGVTVSILQHPIWPELQPFVRIEIYDRDGGHEHPRHRIEIDTPPSGILLRKFLAVEMPCVVCGRTIHPLREREGRGHLYYAATCSLDVTFACARSAAARVEYDAIKAAVDGTAPPPSPQQPLFAE